MHQWLRGPAALLVPLLLAILPGVAGGATLELPSGERLQVARVGRGPAVVLVPGLFGSAFGFRKVMPWLAAEGYEVAVVDPLGFGDSGRPAAADYSLCAQADRVGAAIEALGLRDVILVGHSVGGSIALRLAYRRPALVRAVVSIEGGPSESAVSPGLRRAMKLAPLIRLFGGSRLIRGQVRGQLAARSADPAWVTDAVVDGYTRGPAGDVRATLAAFQRMAQAREAEPLAPRLADIHCPVLLLLGQVPHDDGPTPRELERLAANVPEYEVERVPHAGSFVFEEAPDAVVAAVHRVNATATAGASRLASAHEVMP